MDISLFSKCVKDLIVENDRVEVPYLGTFAAEMMPASYSDRQTTINPPYRKMSFHKGEVSLEQGGLLLGKVAREAGVTQQQAAVELGWCLSRLCSELEGSKTCKLPGLGVMRANARNEFFFVPDDDLDIWPDGLGFEAIPIKVSEKMPDQVGHDGGKVGHDGGKVGHDAHCDSIAEVADGFSSREHFACERNEKPEQPEQPDRRAEKPEQPEQPEPRHGLPVWAIVLIAVGALAVLFVAACYVFTDEMSPILDRLLYSKEELELLQGR